MLPLLIVSEKSGIAKSKLSDNRAPVVAAPVPQTEKTFEHTLLNQRWNSCQTSSTNSRAAIKPTPGASLVNGHAGEAVIAQALRIISEESGVALTDLTDDIIFSNLGIDSFLSLMIFDRFRDELSLEIDGESSIFNDLHTIKDLKGFLTEILLRPGEKTPPSPSPNSASVSVWDAAENSWRCNPTTSTTTLISSDIQSDGEASPISTRPATSVVLQGRPKTDPKTLFLFPDGCGLASSYAELPRISVDLAVIGLNCPYCHHPDEMVCKF